MCSNALVTSNRVGFLLAVIGHSLNEFELKCTHLNIIILHKTCFPSIPMTVHTVPLVYDASFHEYH
jgi:hypothetical protein